MVALMDGEGYLIVVVVIALWVAYYGVCRGEVELVGVGLVCHCDAVVDVEFTEATDAGFFVDGFDHSFRYGCFFCLFAAGCCECCSCEEVNKRFFHIGCLKNLVSGMVDFTELRVHVKKIV